MSLLQSHLNTLLDTYDYNEIVQALENCILSRYNRALSNLEKMQEARLPTDAVIIEQEQEPGTKTLEIKPKEEQKKRQPKKLTPT
jgi:hypothetical protein